jgi:hypothetical protein
MEPEVSGSTPKVRESSGAPPETKFGRGMSGLALRLREILA